MNSNKEIVLVLNDNEIEGFLITNLIKNLRISPKMDPININKVKKS